MGSSISGAPKTVQHVDLLRLTTAPLLLAAVFCLLQTDAHPADWPQWRGINRDGISYESGWFTNWPPTYLWYADIGSNVTTYSSLAVSEGRLYVVGQIRTNGVVASNLICCLNVRNGNTNWSYAFPYLNEYDGKRYDGGYTGIRATPVVDGTNLYLFTPAGELYCLNKYTGVYIWSKTIVAPVPFFGFCGTPLIENNLIFLNMGDGGVAVDKNTRQIVWSNTNGVAAYASPVIYTATNSERIVIFRVEGKTVGVNATNGVIVWTYPWTGASDGNGGQASDPIVFGDKMFLTEGGPLCPTPKCALVQLGTNELTTIWENTTGLVAETSSPVYMNGYLYGLSSRTGVKSELRCIDANTGTLKWSNSVFVTPSTSVSEGSLVGVDDKLLVFSSNRLYVIKATHTNYVVLGSSFQLTSFGSNVRNYVAPVVSDGYISVRQGARVLCYHVGPTNAPDTDADGIGDEWEKKHFTDTANCVANNDNDNDGFSNIQEYSADTSPTNNKDYAKLSMTNTNGRLIMNFPTVRAEGTGYFTRARFYSIESSTSLTASTWSPIPECVSVPATNGSFTCTNTISGPSKFYRMKVTLE